METLIAEALAKIKATEPLRLAKQAVRRKVRQASSTQESKLIGILRELAGRGGH
jgi:hypothetical protein